ncbi:MAG: DNA-binding protein WhiA, partial [Eggerthellaceae bacterium]
ALARIEGTLFFSGPGRYRLEIATEISSVARLIIKSLHQIYALKTELTVRRSVLHKTPNYLIVVPSQPGMEDALHDLGILGESGLEMGIHEHLVEKPCCEASYLRGAFLGSGFIADPRGDFHFEITVENEALAEGLVALMAERNIKARILRRHNSYIVYQKRHGHIGVSRFRRRSSMRPENERAQECAQRYQPQGNAELPIRRKARRLQSTIVSIRKLAESSKVATFLWAQEFVRLRLRYPDASLKELGERANPPLSKSAVYHRVRRLEDMARNL